MDLCGMCRGAALQEVLLVHELEQLLEAGEAPYFATVLPTVLPILVRCVSSDNSRVAQRALQMFSSEKYVTTLLVLVSEWLCGCVAVWLCG